ncbi:unnamed protein product [Peniophora sp. CBMAI 1063]|nr:unnamed protein product [Peniophora sp. CBMAI 1063]
MTRASGSKKAVGASTLPQGGSISDWFKKPSVTTSSNSSTTTGLRPATARPRKEKGRPAERASPRLARRPDHDSASTSTHPNKKLAVYVSLPSRSTSSTRMSSPPPQDDPDALPMPLLRPRFNSSASALSDLTSLHESIQDSSELDPLTSTEDERGPSPIPEPPTVTRRTARKRKGAELPVTPTPTKKRTGRLPSSAKKRRLTSPPADDDNMPVLPSSQSDELEISLGGAMDVDQMADVDPWHIDDEEMADPSSSVHAPASSPHSQRTPNRAQSRHQSQASSPLMTLSPKSKTAKVLAEAKAEARRQVDADAARRAALAAQMIDSDEELNRDVPDVLPESDSEDELEGFFTLKKGKGKGKASTRDSSPSLSSPMVTSSPLLTQRPMRERKQATRRPAVLAAESKAAERRKKSPNPIDKFLREKNAAERKGTGESAFLKAELRESSAETEANMGDFEAAARHAQEGIERAYSGAAYQEDDPHEFNLDKSKKSAMKLLGAEGGKATFDIIEADQLAGPDEGRSSRPVEIWARALGGEVEEDMDVDMTSTPFPVWEPFEGESKSMVMLREAWINDVYPRAINFISASLLDPRVLKASLPVLRSLAQLALSIRPDEAPVRAYRALNDMARKVPKGQVIPFPAALIAQTMAGLGLKAELVAKIWPEALASQPTGAKTSEDRQKILRRMLTLVKNYVVEGGVIPNDEIPSIVMAFIFIANDVETGLDLRITATSTIDAVLSRLSNDRDESHKTEAFIAREIWLYTSSLAPPYQHTIINTFALSNRPSIRICRRVAFHLLLQTPPPSEPDEYLALPSLDPIITLLWRAHDGPFAITAETNYYDLEARAEVLNRMLVGVEEYVILETKKSGLLSSTDAMVHENGAPLEQLEVALKHLYGKINDTGAAHLDRSSAKSWIQMVQLRVHYQREGLKDALSGGRRRGPRKITDFAIASSSKNTSAAVSREASTGPSGSAGVDGMIIGA